MHGKIEILIKLNQQILKKDMVHKHYRFEHIHLTNQFCGKVNSVCMYSAAISISKYLHIFRILY